MDEFSELSKEKAELIANRIYDLDGKFDTQISDDTSNQHHTQIGYKIGGSFEDYSDNGDIGFEILFPHVYASYEEAQYNNYCLSAQMEKWIYSRLDLYGKIYPCNRKSNYQRCCRL